MPHEHLVMPEDHMDELYNSGNPLIRTAHMSRLKAIRGAIDKRKTKQTILDAGCGEGHLVELLHEQFPKHDYVGADITPVALTKARKRCPYATFKKEDLLKLSFKTGSFDVVICTEVIEHIYEYPQVLKELKRVLKKGGILIMTFPNEFNWTIGRFLIGRRPIKVPDHVNSFTPRTMARYVGLKRVKKVNLPFRLPWFCSLGGLLAFKK